MARDVAVYMACVAAGFKTCPKPSPRMHHRQPITEPDLRATIDQAL